MMTTGPTADVFVNQQLSLTESEIGKIGSIKVEGIINPTNAEIDLKDGVGKEWSWMLESRCQQPCQQSRVVLSCCVVISGVALEKAGGKEFLEGLKELRKAQGPLEVASGTQGSDSHTQKLKLSLSVRRLFVFSENIIKIISSWRI